MQTKHLFYISSLLIVIGYASFILFFLAFFHLAKIGVPTETLFAVFFGFFLVYFVMIMLLRIIGRAAFAQLMLYSWIWMKRNRLVRVNLKYKLLAGEREIFPMTPCYVEMKSPVSFDYFPVDVIVTNLRIIVGSRTTILFYTMEKFGSFNFWYPSVRKIQKHSRLTGALSNFAGGQTTTKSMTLENDRRLGKYLRISPAYIIPYKISIYHPQAERIFEEFSFSNQ